MNVHIIPTVIYSFMLGITVYALIDAAYKPKHKQTIFLIGLLILLLIHILGELFIHTGAYQYLPGLAGMQLPIRVLLGPALYFYAYATMSANRKLPKRMCVVALLGPMLVFLAMAPFIFGLSSEEKLALANPLTRDPDNYRLALFACSIAMLVFVVFTFGYLIAALNLHQRHRSQLMNRFATLDRKSMDWLRTVLMLWGFTWLMFALDYITVFMNLQWFGSGVVLPLLEATVLLAFTYLALNQSVLTDADKDPGPASNTRVATLTAEKMEQIAIKLKTAMTDNLFFKEENLSLNELSRAISVSENHISETLSQYLETNFYHFVNGFRVEEAKRLLLSTDMTVSTITFDVGFNSKSTFNTAFKKFVGMTPSAFRTQAESQATKNL